jgi:DNA polymerase (family 10)
VYAAIGLPCIPPELREDAGEVEAAVKGRLPALVTLEDIRGDLHCHTKATDGHATIEAVVAAARRRGYEYVVISDHSRSARIAGGLSLEEMRAHVTKIRAAARRSRDIVVLAGAECDILPDGSMDYPDSLLADLDLVVAAVARTVQAAPGRDDAAPVPRARQPARGRSRPSLGAADRRARALRVRPRAGARRGGNRAVAPRLQGRA